MVTITPLYNSVGSTQQEYDLSQEVLIPIINSSSEFNPVTDQVIFSVEDPNNNLLYTSQIFKFSVRNYENTTDENSISSVVVFPDKDILEAGYDIGEFNVYYNFYRPALNSNIYNYFIQNISANRTEIKLSINNISNAEIEALVQSFSSSLDEGGYFKDFYININGRYYIANNVLLDTTTNQYGILIKLYQALPSSIQNNTQLEVVYEVAETTGFNLVFPPTPIDIVENLEYIKGPNFSYQFSDQTNNSTIESDFSSLLDITQLTSSYNELQNILDQKGIIVNIDYTNFDNFIQFSSAEQRLLNFYYKVGRIESFNNSITLIDSITGATSSSLQVSSSKASFENQITSFIKNFDGYENYLYYSSGSTSFPKSNSTQPYNLQSTGSTEVLTWIGSVNEASPYYGGMLLSASLYDNENQDSLYNTVPTYLSEDPANAGYELFLNMIGQHFDILYSYINTITDRFNTDNRLDYGISRDLVADALRGAGIKLYQNNFSSDDLYSALLGINASGSLLPPTGSEVITNYITASNDAYPLENINKSTYKRLYHNLPYLLNKKGTVEGLRALINCFGIPDTILRISEFGGKDKDNTNDWDYFQNRFNYALYNSGSSTTSRFNSNLIINSNWEPSTSQPSTILFRFKPDSLPTNNTQSIVAFGELNTLATQFALVLDYTGSGALTSGSYSGSIPSQSLEYGTLSLYNQANKIISCSAPFYDGNWWSVLLEQGASAPYQKLKVANSIYKGNDGFKIGYIATSSYSGGAGLWGGGYSSTFYVPAKDTNSISRGSKDYYGLTGSFQEIRYYVNRPDKSSETFFQDYVMNPHSIEGRNYSSSAEDLLFRAPLGSDLITNIGTLTSIHPKITGSYITNSFSGNSNYTIGSNMTFYPQTEYYYYDQPAVGIKNRVSEKIRVAEEVLPTGDTLSAYRSIQQIYPQSESYTRDVNYVEVAFSPQNEINDDINSSMGYFNIGDYIGDPAQFAQSGSSYPPLDKLRDTYFEKYYKNYNWTDYIRLIRYFDNSLFKMIKDFIPARTSLASGVVIKQHLLERNKVTPPQVETSQHVYSGSIESGFMSGSTGGSFNNVNTLGNSPEGQEQGFTNPISPFVTQSWSSTVDTPVGPQIIINSSQAEFYNGEFSGSEVLVTNGNLNVIPPLGTTQKSKSYVYGNPTNSAGVRSFQDSTSYNNTLATLIASLPTELKQSILFLDLDNVGVVNMILGWKTGDEIEEALDDINYGDTINITFTDNGGISPQPISVPYTFTVGNVVKYVDYFELNFINSPQPSPGSYLFNSYIPGNPMLNNVDVRVDVIQTPQENLVILTSENPLYNNVPNNRLSDIYQDVDYADGSAIPVNFNLILNGQAVKFPIPDSNYSQKSWSNGRYNGSRVSSRKFNG
jgi:hypothetical protein